MEAELLAKSFVASTRTTVSAFGSLTVIHAVFFFKVTQYHQKLRLAILFVPFFLLAILRTRLTPAHVPNQLEAHWTFSVVSSLTCLAIPLAKLASGWAPPNMSPAVIAFIHLLAITLARHQHVQIGPRCFIHLCVVVADMEGSRWITAISLAFGEFVGGLLEHELRQTFRSSYKAARRLMELERERDQRAVSPPGGMQLEQPQLQPWTKGWTEGAPSAAAWSEQWGKQWGEGVPFAAMSNGTHRSFVRSVEQSTQQLALHPETAPYRDGADAGNHAQHRIRPEDVVLRDCVGRGGYANVYHATWLDAGVAVKVFQPWSLEAGSTTETKARRVRSVLFEAELLHRLRHPNVCSFYGSYTMPNCAVSIVMEILHGGPLSAMVCFSKMVPSPQWERVASAELLQFSHDIALGLRYLHSQSVIHCDVKLANCILSRDNRVKLCDFGIAVIGQLTPLDHHGSPVNCASTGTATLHATTATGECTRASLGSPRYQAPELLAHLNEPIPVPTTVMDARCDVYSYGLALYEIMHGRVAFAPSTAMSAMHIASRGERPVCALRPEHVRLGALIEACWENEPAKRPTMAQVVSRLNKERFEG